MDGTNASAGHSDTNWYPHQKYFKEEKWGYAGLKKIDIEKKISKNRKS